jgi:undecaprenyl diphosphate synthase
MEDTKPQCLGFIMDGNRRWATDQGLASFAGHKQGGEVLQDCITWLRDEQIPHAVFYAFSTENWNRSEQEVAYLMDLFRDGLQKIDKRLNDQNDKEVQDAEKVKVRIVGRREDFAPDIVEQMNALEARSQDYPDARTTIWLALSYGGRAEIIQAVNQAITAGEPVDEATFEQLLWTADMPDPDLIVRTSGEQRLSNFMTWRSVYSELYFISKHWPALTKDDFKDILEEYSRRNRRNGK